MIREAAMEKLRAFLELNGCSLQEHGSAEFGLSRTDAMLFLDLLAKARERPLGIEVWMSMDGDFAIDTLGGWYSEDADPAINADEARKFMTSVPGSEEDLFTIQFD